MPRWRHRVYHGGNLKPATIVQLTTSPMSSLDTLFRDLRAAKRKALMPFITAGDPDLEFTADVLRCLVAQGAVCASWASPIATRSPTDR